MSKQFDPCQCCGKPVRVDVSYWTVHLIEGGARTRRADEPVPEDDGGDLGLHAVGPACARRLQREGAFTTKLPPWEERIAANG